MPGKRKMADQYKGVSLMNSAMRISLAAVGLVFSLSVFAEDDYDKAVHVYGCADYPKAYNLFKPLAEKGDAPSQFQVGMMTEQGQGTEASYENAYPWYKKAAEQGMTDAYFALGQLYARGLAVPLDTVQAYAWFDLAVRGGHAVAGDWLNMQANKMMPDQIEQARRVADDWLQKLKR
jgi:TPR repeat protein